MIKNKKNFSEASNKKNLVLMLSHLPGQEIANFFSIREKENIKAIYFEEKSTYSEFTLSKLKVDNDLVFYGKEILSDSQHISWLKGQNIDFAITVYWPWLISKEYLEVINDSINFHPALLPINRGWYPHVHSIIDGSPAGVTLHKISEGADQGDIWVQKEIILPFYKNVKEIYLMLQNEIINLFKDNWDLISNGSIKTFSQKESNSSYHSKKEIDKLDKIEFDKLTSKELYNLLRARSFGHKGFAYIEENGVKYFINMRISENSNFDN